MLKLVACPEATRIPSKRCSRKPTTFTTREYDPAGREREYRPAASVRPPVPVPRTEICAASTG